MNPKIYIWTSPLPLLAFWGVTFYIQQFDGWGKGFAGILLLGPIVLSLVMGAIGVVLILQARKQKKPTSNLWLSTTMASSVFLYYLARGILL